MTPPSKRKQKQIWQSFISCFRSVYQHSKNVISVGSKKECQSWEPTNQDQWSKLPSLEWKIIISCFKAPFLSNFEGKCAPLKESLWAIWRLYLRPSVGLVYLPTFTKKNQPNVGKDTSPMNGMGQFLFAKIKQCCWCFRSSRRENYMGCEELG